MSYNLTEENIIARRPTKQVYHDGNSTIKLFENNYSKSKILNEALNQVKVEESTDLKIAKLREVTTFDGRWALVSEHIEGNSLEELMNLHPEKEDEYLELFVRIQLEVIDKRITLINSMKEKYKRKINENQTIDNSIKYELLQRLEGIEAHEYLCHGDFNPSNIIIKENGEHFIIDWAHVTKGNTSGDVALTYLLFKMNGKDELAEKYFDLFTKLSGMDKGLIQRWIPIVAATQLEKYSGKEEEFLRNWINVAEY